MRIADMKRTGLRNGLFLMAIAAILPPSGMAQKDTDVRLNTDLPGAAVFEKPQIAASGDSVYVTWMDTRNDFGVDHHLEWDIYFNRSLDGGATWLPSDIRLDTDLPGAARSEVPQIAASGDSVYVTWWDGRDGTADIYFNRSLDGGATWLTSDIRLDTKPRRSRGSF